MLPWYLPGALGTVSRSTSGEYCLTIKFGRLQLSHLAVGKDLHPGPVALSAGASSRYTKGQY